MQIIKNWKDKHNGKQQSIKFSLEDHVGKVTISKNTSPEMIKMLYNCNFNCDVIIKEK